MDEVTLDTLRKKYEEAKKEYEYWTTGTKCVPGSQKWNEVEAIYKIASDAYNFALKNIEPTQTVGKMVESSPDPKKVFVIHGRDERLRDGMFQFLRALGLDPLEWSRATALTGKASPYIGEILDAAFHHAKAVLALLSPDDQARLREDLVNENDPDYEKQLTGQARPNVLFEAGMAFASHPSQTVLVEIGKLRPFSDVAGRHVVRMDNSPQKRLEVAQKLQTVGCPVDFSETDWTTVGDLTPPDNNETINSNTKVDRDSQSTSTTKPLSVLHGQKEIVVSPVSRSSGSNVYRLGKEDELGVLVELKNREQVRIPTRDYIPSWDDVLGIPKLELTRKYFQGYFPGHEHAEEYFLPR